MAGTEWVIPAKFGPFRTNRFDVIAIFLNFNWSPAAILDFAKFHFGPQNRLWGAETKPRFKFGENRTHGFGDIALLVFFKMAACGHLGFQKFQFFMIRSCWGCRVDDYCQIWSISD